MGELKFRHEVIDPDPPGAQHDVTLIVDVNGDGRNDIIIGGKKGDPHVFWYENPSWNRHDMIWGTDLEAGGVIVDINRDGRPDVVVGQQGRGKELYWFENPEDPTKPWIRHVIENRFERYHDQAVGDIDGDGEKEILISSQNVGIIAYYDIPEDPTVSPWPQDCCHVLADDMGSVTLKKDIFIPYNYLITASCRNKVTVAVIIEIDGFAYACCKR